MPTKCARASHDLRFVGQVSGAVHGRFGAAARGRRPELRLGPVHVRGLQRPGPDIHDGFPDRVHVAVRVRRENAAAAATCGTRRPHVVVGVARPLVPVRRRPVPVAVVGSARSEVRHRHDRGRRGHIRRHDRAPSARPRYTDQSCVRQERTRVERGLDK